jgi:nicotinamide mononucleotide transporter
VDSIKISFIETLEILVVLTTLLYNYFLIKQNIICWLFGFLASLLGLIIFYEKQLIGQIILHVFYTIMAVYGWYIWGRSKKQLPINRWPIINHVYVIGSGILLTFILGNFVLNKFTENVNFLDISITLFCFVATFKEAHKILSAWLYWIVLNLASLILYMQSNLKIYALLMFIYTILSIKGYLVWRKNLSETKLG